MNIAILIGRLTRDPEVRQAMGDNATLIANYTLAVDRRRSGKQEADFIRCTAFGNSAEFAEKYLKKGTKILVKGRIQTGSYEKDGHTIYTTDVIVEGHEFVESKNTQPAENTSAEAEGFLPVGDIPEDELPFA